MRYLVFGAEQSTYKIALLSRLLRPQDLSEYIKDIETEVVAYAITTGTKANNSQLKEYLAELMPILCTLQTDYVLVTDGSLFKIMAGVPRVDRVSGYVLPCKIKGYEHMFVVHVPSPQQLIYDPTLRLKLNQGLNALKTHRSGSYEPPGTDIIHFQEYPNSLKDIAIWLDKLVDKPLAIDIECFDLKHYKAGIGTIALAWSKHEGIAFAVDYKSTNNESAPFGKQVKNEPVRNLLKQFFRKRLETKTLYHNGSFDVYVLIYQLFMLDLIDTAGMLEGLEMMMGGFEDTQLVTYLATNSCAGNHLSLKAQSQEFAGNYMIDVKDVCNVKLGDLLTYNLVDALATWFVWEKNYPVLVADNQSEIYEGLFKPAVKDIIQMQLTGMPIDMDEVASGKAEMQLHSDTASSSIKCMPAIVELERQLTDAFVEKKNAEYKVKRITAAEVKDRDECKLNLNSPLKLQKLLYEVMGLPIITYTNTKQPGTDGDTIKALINHTNDPNHKQLLQSLIDFKAVDKILTTFIPAFEQAQLGPDGNYYLFGFYNLGGALSGRLSSNGPNMQNLPSSGSRYSKLVKRMFRAPNGWLLVGLDFNSLEDMISALTTKDPNKLRVYVEGFDGHCLRAYSYFKEQMTNIRQVPLDAICYTAKVGSTYVRFTSEDFIDYEGQRYTGQEFYEMASNSE